MRSSGCTAGADPVASSSYTTSTAAVATTFVPHSATTPPVTPRGREGEVIPKQLQHHYQVQQHYNRSHGDYPTHLGSGNSSSSCRHRNHHLQQHQQHARVLSSPRSPYTPGGSARHQHQYYHHQHAAQLQTPTTPLSMKMETTYGEDDLYLMSLCSSSSVASADREVLGELDLDLLCPVRTRKSRSVHPEYMSPRNSIQNDESNNDDSSDSDYYEEQAGQHVETAMVTAAAVAAKAFGGNALSSDCQGEEVNDILSEHSKNEEAEEEDPVFLAAAVAAVEAAEEEEEEAARSEADFCGSSVDCCCDANGCPLCCSEDENDEFLGDENLESSIEVPGCSKKRNGGIPVLIGGMRDWATDSGGSTGGKKPEVTAADLVCMVGHLELRSEEGENLQWVHGQNPARNIPPSLLVPPIHESDGDCTGAPGPNMLSGRGIVAGASGFGDSSFLC